MMLKKPLRIFIFFVICLIFASVKIYAVEVSLFPQEKTIGISEQFEVKVTVDTVQSNINAIEGTISIPVENFKVREIRDANSIISLWIDKPEYENNQITFSGIIPGGFEGNGDVFSIIFEGVSLGQGLVELNNLRILQNDDMGTEMLVSIQSSSIKVIQQNAVGTSLDTLLITDDEQPESFKPEIIKNKNLFEGKAVLIFLTQDKQSGIDHYEVKEGDGTFKNAESPYLLENQKLNKNIEVKAVDKFGNERIETLQLSSNQGIVISEWVVVVLISTVLLIVLVSWKVLWRKK